MERFWEIDAVRGLAVALMVLFNWTFALYYLGLYKIAESGVYWEVLPRLIAGTFIAISGACVPISYARRKNSRRLAMRSAKVFALGLLVTAATWLYAPRDFIVFGILHFIGIATLISVPLLKASSRIIAAAAAVSIIIGAYLETQAFAFPWLVWLGFMPLNFRTLDYFPVFPWIGVTLAGMLVGRALYPGGKRAFKIRKENAPERLIARIGRHSLAIYIAHQPLLIAVLYALGLLG